MSEWVRRQNAPFPFQTWRPFPKEAIVQIRNAHGQRNIGPAGSFWWGYEEEAGEVGEGVITAARRLDRPKKEAAHGTG